LKSFFNGSSIDEEERKRLFIFSIVFGLILVLEITATIYAVVELIRFSKRVERKEQKEDLIDN
jgi:hypothetical protein